MKEIEGSTPLLSVSLPKPCDLESHNGLSVTLGHASDLLQYSQNEQGVQSGSLSHL